MSVPAQLREFIKNRLDITWNDSATDAKITGIIEEGIAYLDGILGVEGDYETATASRRLLVEYCRYSRDSALDVFENNYLSQLLAMQNERKVSAYVESTAQSD